MSCTARTAARREEVPPVKTKKASLLTKLVVLALLIGAATGLLNLRQQILTAQSDLAEAEAQVAAQKTAMIPTGRPTSPAASWAW